jgi:two-component system OmpR family response regulator
MRKHVLVVEDEPDIGYLMRLVIEQGHTVTLAASVTEARTALDREGRPDLVVLDVMLSDGSGLDLCRELKLRYPRLPVVVVSAYLRGGRVDPARLRGCGADAVVGKPFEPDHLQRVIDRLVQAA